MCKHTLTHIIAKKCNFCLKKQRKTMILAIFGDFRVFDMTSLMSHCDVIQGMFVLFFGTNGLGRVIAIHQYHTLDVSSISFRDLGGAESAPPPGCEMGPKSPGLLGLMQLTNQFELIINRYFELLGESDDLFLGSLLFTMLKGSQVGTICSQPRLQCTVTLNSNFAILKSEIIFNQSKRII